VRTWREEHDDPTAEPYTVLHIRRAGEVKWRFNPKSWDTDEPVMFPVPPGTFYFHVFFRTYRKKSWLSVEGRDELDAFILADKQLTRRKRQADNRLKKQGANQ
jgi:hypothetical protein